MRICEFFVTEFHAGMILAPSPDDPETIAGGLDRAGMSELARAVRSAETGRTMAPDLDHPADRRRGYADFGRDNSPGRFADETDEWRRGYQVAMYDQLAGVYPARGMMPAPIADDAKG